MSTIPYLACISGSVSKAQVASGDPEEPIPRANSPLVSLESSMCPMVALPADSPKIVISLGLPPK